MNMHYRFYVRYPDQFFDRHAQAPKSVLAADYLEMENQKLAEAYFPAVREEEISLPGMSMQSFGLWTTYPGLLMGVGYAHDMGGKGDLSLGFSFDYVSGRPYLPGSSVKGVLRSAFAHPECIRDCCPQIPDDETVARIGRHIFGSSDQEENGKDVFLDAIVGTDGGRLLALDAITPHRKGAMKEMSEPTPIAFLKVGPNVRVAFRFLLTESRIEDVLITPEMKRELFMELILLMGVGAKTNVGYGAMVGKG